MADIAAVTNFIRYYANVYAKETTYQVITRYIDLLSDKEITEDGLYTDGYGNESPEYNDNTLVYLTPEAIITLYERHAPVIKIPVDASRLEMYNMTSKYLNAWAILINNGFNHNLVPTNDLRIINNMLNAMAKTLNSLEIDVDVKLRRVINSFLGITDSSVENQPGKFEAVNRKRDSDRINDVIANSAAKQHFDIFGGG